MELIDILKEYGHEPTFEHNDGSVTEYLYHFDNNYGVEIIFTVHLRRLMITPIKYRGLGDPSYEPFDIPFVVDSNDEAWNDMEPLAKNLITIANIGYTPKKKGRRRKW